MHGFQLGYEDLSPFMKKKRKRKSSLNVKKKNYFIAIGVYLFCMFTLKSREKMFTF